jgi:hypothetical protein
MKITTFRFGVLFAILLGGAALVGAEDGSGWKSPRYLVDAFVEVALKSEYSTRQHPVRKWTSPVNYFIVQQAGDEELHGELIRTHLAHLSAITGLPIRPADTRAAANYLIVLTSADKLEADLLTYFGPGPARLREQFYRDSVCMATFAAGHKGSIYRAVAVIPVDTARGSGNLLSCVAEELTHAMGLPNDTFKSLPSIFSHRVARAFLSGLDQLLLKMLYDPRVKPGMSEKILRPLLQTIANEYELDNRFETADGEAAAAGLAAYGR